MFFVEIPILERAPVSEMLNASFCIYHLVLFQTRTSIENAWFRLRHSSTTFMQSQSKLTGFVGFYLEKFLVFYAFNDTGAVDVTTH